MLADEVPVTGVVPRGVLRWLIDRTVYDLTHGWACYWWLLRAHVAAAHFIPRSCLEEPPEPWMRVMHGPGGQDR